MLTAIDLFAGAGGLSYGLHGTGFTVRAAVELDITSAETFRLNHRGAVVLTDDIRRITGPKLLAAAGVPSSELDLLTGCPPCQGFSSLRTHRKGLNADSRNELIFEFLRLIRSTRPRAVLMENVAALAGDIRLAHFAKALRRRSYGVAYRVLRASDYGVPQRRRRLVLLAVQGATEDEASSMLESPKVPPRTVRDTIAHLPKAGTSGDPLHDLPEQRSAKVIRIIRAIPKDGGSRGCLPKDLQLACHTRANGYSDVYGRMAWDKPAPTITTGCHNPSRGRFTHPSEDRAITLREAALLQTFPPHYRFSLRRGKEHAAKQIGNAFPPTLIRPIAARLAQSLL